MGDAEVVNGRPARWQMQRVSATLDRDGTRHGRSGERDPPRSKDGNMTSERGRDWDAL